MKWRIIETTYNKSTPLPLRQVREKSRVVIDSITSKCTQFSEGNAVCKQQILEAMAYELEKQSPGTSEDNIHTNMCEDC